MTDSFGPYRLSCFWIMNKNKQTHSSKDEPAGNHKSRASLRTSRRVNDIMSYGNLVRTLFYYDKWKFDECAAFGGSAYVFKIARSVTTREQSWPPTWTSSLLGTLPGWWGPCRRRWKFSEQLWKRWYRRMDKIAEIAFTSSSKTALLPTISRGHRMGSWSTLRRCGRRRSGLPAPLTATLWTILRGASLN